jgi:hypothetical protein
MILLGKAFPKCRLLFSTVKVLTAICIYVNSSKPVLTPSSLFSKGEVAGGILHEVATIPLVAAAAAHPFAD